MRLLVFGGWGQLGADLAVAAEGRHELIRPPHAEVDVTDPGDVREAVARAHPDVVVDLAAFHKVERCEEDPDSAFAVNALGALHVGRAARAAEARCVYVSTDYVFDGAKPEGYTEHDPVAPLNVYGASKAAGEHLVRVGCPDSLVVRGSGLFGHAGSSGKGGNFVENILAKARAGEEIRVVDDLVFAPTATRDMADRLLGLLERAAPPGVYHLTNAGSCSWYELARAVLDLAGLPVDVAPRPSPPDGVPRPRCSILRDTATGPLGLPPARPWRDAVGWYLQERPRPGASSPAR